MLMRDKLAITNQTNSKGFQCEMDLHFLVLDVVFQQGLALRSYMSSFQLSTLET